MRFRTRVSSNEKWNLPRSLISCTQCSGIMIVISSWPREVFFFFFFFFLEKIKKKKKGIVALFFFLGATFHIFSFFFLDSRSLRHFLPFFVSSFSLSLSLQIFSLRYYWTSYIFLFFFSPCYNTTNKRLGGGTHIHIANISPQPDLKVRGWSFCRSSSIDRSVLRNENGVWTERGKWSKKWFCFFVFVFFFLIIILVLFCLCVCVCVTRGLL